MNAPEDGAAPAPVERFGFRTRDVDRAHESIRNVYVGHQRTLFGRGTRCRYDLRIFTAGDLSVDSLRYTAEVEIVTEPLDWLQAELALAPLSVAAPGERIRMARGDVVLLPLGVPLTIRWDDLNLRILRMPMTRVAEVAAARSGIEATDFRFETMVPISARLGAFWRDTMTYLHRSLAAPDSAFASPLVRAAAMDTVAAAALAAFPNNASTVAYLPGPGRVAPAAVRRAVAYIDANADRPVTLAEIAAAARVGPRGLQAAFTRYLGCSPTAYLRQVRLERAHLDLQAADPTAGDTVTEIARRWGWSNLGRFAAAYRAAYGRSPGRTLRS